MMFPAIPKPLRFATHHHRLLLFWIAAIVGLPLPWLTSCQHSSLVALLQAEETCTVDSIYDGDTMRLTCDGQPVRVRLYCIDAPEMNQEPWGKAARDHLRGITTKTVILIRKDRDRYGRIVGEILANGYEGPGSM